MIDKNDQLNKSIPKSIKKKKDYYKPFVFYCIIWLVGFYGLSTFFCIHYLEFSFLYLIIIPICFIFGMYIRYVKKVKNGSLYLSLWACFCIASALYSIVNILYTEKQDSRFFSSHITDVAASGYRSPSGLFFELDNKMVFLTVSNEIPVKEKLDKGQTVEISGKYKEGLLSSIMIVCYSITDISNTNN